jgi:hypothetical protein
MPGFTRRRNRRQAQRHPAGSRGRHDLPPQPWNDLLAKAGIVDVFVTFQ